MCRIMRSAGELDTARRTPEATKHLRASLIEHSQRIVARDGASGLTMRSLAAEAGCAVGLPYKVFDNRQELLMEILQVQFAALRSRSRELISRAGTGTVADNLTRFAERVLGSTAVALVHEVAGDPALAKAFAEQFHGTDTGPALFENAFAGYLAAEQRAGRIAPDVDTRAFGFLLGGAIRNLVMSGEAYPRPSKRKLKQLLTATTDAIANPPRHLTPEEPNATIP
jgi:AcrR family transcriptional regulator